MHAFSSRNILSAPNLDLLDVAPMSLCRVDLVVEDDIDDNYRERYLDKDTHSNMRGRWTLDKY